MADSASDDPPEQALALVLQQLHGRVWGLRVVVQEGGVILQGEAHSYYAKQLAQHVVMKSLGMPVVANQIEVKPPPPAQASADPL